MANQLKSADTLLTREFHHLGGTQRARLPDETLAWLRDKYPSMGITRVANVTGLDHVGICIATSIRPNARHLSVAQGKGITLQLAKISALMESIESYHAELPPAASLRGNYAELKQTYPLIDPHLFATGAFCLNHLEQRTLDWVQAKDLISGKLFYLPHALVCLDTTQNRVEYGIFNVSTNGLAAGNTIEEALCHAIYEVIERNHLSDLQAGKFNLEECQLNLDSIHDKINQPLLDKLLHRLEVIVWDITGEFDIPTFHTAIYDPTDPMNGRVYTGSGTHLQKEIALSRALTEAAQARVTLITGMRDDLFPEYYEISQLAAMHEKQHFFHQGKRFFQDCIQPQYADSFDDILQFLKQKLLQNHYPQVYWVNHTKKDINIPVVQVFIPGLQHDHSRN